MKPEMAPEVRELSPLEEKFQRIAGMAVDQIEGRLQLDPDGNPSTKVRDSFLLGTLRSVVTYYESKYNYELQLAKLLLQTRKAGLEEEEDDPNDLSKLPAHEKLKLLAQVKADVPEPLLRALQLQQAGVLTPDDDRSADDGGSDGDLREPLSGSADRPLPPK